MWVPVAVWQPCELLYTCYLLLTFRTESTTTIISTRCIDIATGASLVTVQVSSCTSDRSLTDVFHFRNSIEQKWRHDLHAPSGSITFAPNAETRQKIRLTPGIKKRVSKVISRRAASPPRIHLCSCIHRGTHSNLIPENPYKSSHSQNASGFCEVLTRVYVQTTSRSVQPFWQLDRVPNNHNHASCNARRKRPHL